VSEKGFRVEIPVHIKRDQRARKVLAEREAPKSGDSVPRIARLLALAHKWEGMVRRGETDYAELARRHGLSSARVSQVCSLTLLAPEIEESVVLSSSLSRQCLAAMAARPLWREQRRL
jgi:hypothetical protein